jgi:stalled ribosome rescue protein Dom34
MKKTFKVRELFGISKKQADDALQQFREIEEDSQTYTEIARKLRLIGKRNYQSYVLGRYHQFEINSEKTIPSIEVKLSKKDAESLKKTLDRMSEKPEKLWWKFW